MVDEVKMTFVEWFSSMHKTGTLLLNAADIKGIKKALKESKITKDEYYQLIMALSFDETDTMENFVILHPMK